MVVAVENEWCNLLASFIRVPSTERVVVEVESEWWLRY